MTETREEARKEAGGPVHICLVSDEALSNITPALASLADSVYFPPRKVILLHEPKYEEQAGYLRGTLESHDIVVEVVPVTRGVLPIDLAALECQIAAVFDALSPLERIYTVLNATGGSKALSLAAVSVFTRNRLPIFIVDAQSDHIVWLGRSARQIVDIPDHATLEDVLSAHGFRVTGPKPVRDPVDREKARLCRALVENAGRFSDVIGAFNGYMSRAKEVNGHFKAGPVSNKLRGNQAFEDLVDLFCKAGLMWRDHRHLLFKGRDNARFIRGGWFELYVYGVVDELKRDWLERGHRVAIGDLASGVNIESPTGSRNEIDVAFLCNNRLYLIECKTGYFHPDSHPTGPASTMLYKMDWLRELGAPASKASIVSYRRLSPHDLDRAQHMGIDVLAGPKGVRRLRRFLEQWIELPLIEAE